MVRDRQSILCRTEKPKGAVLPESTVDAGSGFFFFCEHFFLFTEKEKKRKCFGAELLGSLSDIGGMITGSNRGGNQTGYIDASGNYHQRTCFVKGSMISTLEGQKTIESLKLGDKALSWNPETGKLEYRMITNLFERKTDLIYKLTFSSGHSVETTWNHPFWVSSTGTSTDSTGSPTTGSVSDISSLQAGKWIETKDLKVGDVLKTANSSSLFISAISTDARVETVYNFEVEGNHTYFVGEDGVLVHNDNYITEATVKVAATLVEGYENLKSIGKDFVQDPIGTSKDIGKFLTDPGCGEGVSCGNLPLGIPGKGSMNSLNNSVLKESGVIDPQKVRFTQNSISNEFKDGKKLNETVDALKSGKIKPEQIETIRVFEKDNKVYSLDNRRLEAFKQSGIKKVPYRKATDSELKEELPKKFTTTNDGKSIQIRQGKK